MKSTLLAAIAAAVVISGQAFAVEYCPTPVVPATMQVPVTTYVEEPRQYTVTRMVPNTRTVQVPQRRAVQERVQVPCTRTEWVNETYTTTESRWSTRPETRMRKRTTTVIEEQPRTVRRRFSRDVCDECGRSRRVHETACVTEMVPVRRRVVVDEPYTVNVRYRVNVPVTKTRRVARQVPATREVMQTRYVTEMVNQTVTEMQPVSQVMGYTVRRPVTTYQTVPAPAPVAPACGTSACY